jgi:hypothetical protein
MAINERLALWPTNPGVDKWFLRIIEGGGKVRSETYMTLVTNARDRLLRRP